MNGAERHQQEPIERWFVRRGLPHAIADYRASTDVFTRAAPFLALVFFAEMFVTFNDRFEGWAQLGVFLLGAAILLGAAVGVNLLRGRRPLQVPDDVGPLELAVFVLVPAVLPALVGSSRTAGVVQVVVLNLVILGLVYVVTSYALLPMVGWAARHLLGQLTGLAPLAARTLPLVIIFATFIFLNAEVWQVAHDFIPAYYALVVGVLVLLAGAFLAFRLPGEIDRIADFDRWAEIDALVVSSDCPPVLGSRAGEVDPPAVESLSTRERLNVVLLLFIGQMVQLVLVAVTFGAFYVLFGMFAVRRETLLQWTTATPETLEPLATFEFLGGEVVITWELLAVSGFIAAFAMLQISVSLLSDSTYRDEFFAPLEHEAREVLAVRARYLDHLESPDG